MAVLPADRAVARRGVLPVSHLRKWDTVGHAQRFLGGVPPCPTYPTRACREYTRWSDGPPICSEIGRTRGTLGHCLEDQGFVRVPLRSRWDTGGTPGAWRVAGRARGHNALIAARVAPSTGGCHGFAVQAQHRAGIRPQDQSVEVGHKPERWPPRRDDELQQAWDEDHDRHTGVGAQLLLRVEAAGVGRWRRYCDRRLHDLRWHRLRIDPPIGRGSFPGGSAPTGCSTPGVGESRI